MKKLLLFVSTVFLSLLFVNNNVYAQEYPDVTMRVPFSGSYIYVGENSGYTYEFLVDYVLENVIIENLDENDYYFVSNNPFLGFRKGYNPNFDSYVLEDIDAIDDTQRTIITLRITVDVNIMDDYGNPNSQEDVSEFFMYDSALYVTFYHDIDDYYNDLDDYYNRGYSDGYNEGYNEGYNDGLEDINVADYFGTQNIAKAPDISFGTASDALEPSTAIVLVNKGQGAPNILLDKPYLIVIIKKNIYNHVVVLFDDYSPIYHYEATYHDIGEHDIYVFDFSDRVNSKYKLEIRKENVTTSEQLNKFLNDVKGNLYFSHASKLLTSSLASQLYYFGYLVGLEENITDNDAYRIGYDTGYNRGYNDGNEDGYDQGFEDGYNQGFDYGKTVEYEQGYNDGYNDGYSDGIKKPFYSNFHVWIVPAIIIVVIAGIFVGYRRERYDGD